MELMFYKCFLVVVHEYHESKSISIRTAPSDVCSTMPPLFLPDLAPSVSADHQWKRGEELPFTGD